MKALTNQNYPLAIFIGLSLWSLNTEGYAQLQPNRPTFFEDGYRQLNQEIQQLEKQPANPDPLLTVDTGELRWQKMISREGGFSLWIPAGIQTDEVRSVAISDNTLEFEVISTNQPNSRFIVAYSEPLNSTALSNSNSIFEQIIEYIITDTNFEVMDNPSQPRQQYSGSSVILTGTNEKIYLQLYLMNNRIYVLGVNQKSESDLSQVSQHFFESFQNL